MFIRLTASSISLDMGEKYLVMFQPERKFAWNL
jgi:hypothetical protein